MVRLVLLPSLMLLLAACQPAPTNEDDGGVVIELDPAENDSAGNQAAPAALPDDQVSNGAVDGNQAEGPANEVEPAPTASAPSEKKQESPEPASSSAPEDHTVENSVAVTSS